MGRGIFCLLKLLFYYKAEILTKWSVQQFFTNDSMMKSKILMAGSMMSIVTYKFWCHEWACEQAYKRIQLCTVLCLHVYVYSYDRYI